MFKFDKSMFGRKVRFINVQDHEEMSEYYPEVGTIGILTPIKNIDELFAVQWPEGSTSMEDCWLADEESLELVEEVVDKP